MDPAMTPDEYENVVADIVSGICQNAPELDGFRLGSGRSNRLSGASGYKHQIDVSLSGDNAIYLIECKRWKTKIGVEEVMVLAARATDIVQGTNGVPIQAILASKVGVTRGAKTLAEYFNIQLEVVRSAHEFGMRIGRNVRVGVASKLMVTDSITATVYPPERAVEA